MLGIRPLWIRFALELLFGFEVQNELDNEVSEFVVDQLLNAYLGCCDNLHALVCICQQDALLDHLAAMLVPCYLLKML